MRSESDHNDGGGDDGDDDDADGDDDDGDDDDVDQLMRSAVGSPPSFSVLAFLIASKSWPRPLW